MDLKNAFESGRTYQEYRTMLNELLDKGLTTGQDQSEGMINYAKLNNKRMDRGDKVVKLDENWVSTVNSLDIQENWLVITEGWCGDASQIVPVLAKIEEAIPGIQMKLILRDENLEIMDAFQTNGTRSIPKLIRLDAQGNEVLGSWGPRPQLMQDMVDEWKESQAYPKEEMYAKVHGAYAKDRGKEVLGELLRELSLTYSEMVD